MQIVVKSEVLWEIWNKKVMSKIVIRQDAFQQNLISEFFVGFPNNTGRFFFDSFPSDTHQGEALAKSWLEYRREVRLWARQSAWESENWWTFQD